MRLKSFLLSVLWLVMLFSAGRMHGQSYTSIVVFGDSLSDTGNFASVINSGYGVRYPGAAFNYADGRFTSGTTTIPPTSAYAGVWIEQLAAQFTAKPTVVNSLNGGKNYAYGDATTQDGTQTVPIAGGFSVQVPNMGQQVATYLATTPAPNANTLYVVFGGSNDLLADSSTAGVTAAAQREATLVQRLIAAGATQFMVPNLPPLGNTPSSRGTSNATTLNTASSLFRTLLASDLQAVIATAATSGKTVTIYQPDLYTQTMAVETTPMNYAITNAIASEQGATTSFPDAYLFWDDIHPTTTGHHFIAGVAEGTLSALAASSTVATATAIPSSSMLTLKAAVTGTGPTTKPTGLVTFYGTAGTATTPLATAILDATGTGTATYTGTSPASVTAVYAGDTAYSNSTSAAATVSSTISSTTTVLTASSTALTVGTSDTFTATVTSPGGTPAGAVTFYSGMAMLGTGTLNGTGVATFTTASLAVGADSITAVYAANGAFAGSTSAAVVVTVTAPTVSVSFSPSTLTVTHGSSGTVTVSVSSVGATGTVALSCGTLPAHASCTFSPASVTLNGTGTQTSTLTIGTTAVSALSRPAMPGRRRGEMAAYACTLLVLGLGAAGRRRRWMPSLLAALLMTGGTLFLGGCGGSSSSATSTPTTTTAGTYSVVVTATVGGSTAVSSQGTLSVVVQ